MRANRRFEAQIARYFDMLLSLKVAKTPQVAEWLCRTLKVAKTTAGDSILLT